MIKVTSKAAEELKGLKERALAQGIGHDCGDHACGHSCAAHADLDQDTTEHDCNPSECDVHEHILRLVPAEGGRAGLILDMYREGDQVVEHNGEKILVVGPELSDAVSNLVFDCVDTPEGSQLTIAEAEAG
jgi:hypothetical protein